MCSAKFRRAPGNHSAPGIAREASGIGVRIDLALDAAGNLYIAEAGADAISLVNTFLAMAIDVHTHGGTTGITSKAPPNGNLANGMREGSLAVACLADVPDGHLEDGVGTAFMVSKRTKEWAPVPAFTTLVVVSVTDNGRGIASNHLPNIFRPFFTTKGQGTGLGLSISRSIIEAHGGRIAMTTARGEGTAFTVHLPRAERLPSAATG